MWCPFNFHISLLCITLSWKQHTIHGPNFPASPPDLIEVASLPLGTMYSLSPSELESLQMFWDKYLVMGFIHPSSFSHAALVLFIHKKDGSLHLCINFRGLNKIMKKDYYPLPHMLWATLRYTPNLSSSTHTKGNEWKMSFCTHYGSYEWLIMPLVCSA